MKPYCFFAHVAFALDARAHASPQATANLIIEIDDTTLTSCGNKKHVKVSALTDSQKMELAGEIAMAAALDYLRSEEHTSELQSRVDIVCRLLLEKKKDLAEARCTPSGENSTSPQKMRARRSESSACAGQLPIALLWWIVRWRSEPLGHTRV